mmetsp:Transcript_1232/g.1617  ORF Transcript_1232/g.1617 Transcript_1232/m.1617 type:complete len:100 (-) Transcript_1232:340-639(-)|eukprot:CAMPEP_0194759628 /NCGR_PEP_ID=MMETSP0323_2-20130528/12652_1 /TAXON_ID=2866 ORGANISM="Crypthecodinium cohnii, Strain Seligo" /NCGR_SAMPLE_ID=MMETSP0323_2 /ASSEMBLY_ACC=CAM_ASM_000346 /LENGTH=99 /DNA_ID=CAMNT_0039680459 /DNA_START=201 /DNA_END=500 /DNA_ORIENTATION=-
MAGAANGLNLTPGEGLPGLFQLEEWQCNAAHLALDMSTQDSGSRVQPSQAQDVASRQGILAMRFNAEGGEDLNRSLRVGNDHVIRELQHARDGSFRLHL